MFDSPALKAIALSLAIVVASIGVLLGSRTPSTTPPILSQSIAEVLKTDWVVTPEQAKMLLDRGAILLDARSPSLLQQNSPGAIPVRWQDFSQSQPENRGKLLADDRRLEAKLTAMGISSDRPVIVVGDPINGWGESGRIAWMLRVLGHEKAAIVDGGAKALLQLQARASSPPQPGNFSVQRQEQWSISRDELRAILDRPNLIIIDTRSRAEYRGATPYGERRGGHVPGAIHLHFKELLDREGNLLTPEAMDAKLAAKGINRETEIVAYCTGGVRSAWLSAILVNAGYRAKNYPGSMWEWSAAPPQNYPLIE